MHAMQASAFCCLLLVLLCLEESWQASAAAVLTASDAEDRGVERLLPGSYLKHKSKKKGTRGLLAVEAATGDASDRGVERLLPSGFLKHKGKKKGTRVLLAVETALTGDVSDRGVERMLPSGSLKHTSAANWGRHQKNKKRGLSRRLLRAVNAADPNDRAAGRLLPHYTTYRSTGHKKKTGSSKP